MALPAIGKFIFETNGNAAQISIEEISRALDAPAPVTVRMAATQI